MHSKVIVKIENEVKIGKTEKKKERKKERNKKQSFSSSHKVRVGGLRNRDKTRTARKEKGREINFRAIWFLILKQTALLNNILFVCLFLFLPLRLAFCGHMSTVVGGTPSPSF
jgi:predicted RNA binding protein with dsRBD fold (UPF0201 family)